jgi:hypothetical protein
MICSRRPVWADQRWNVLPEVLSEKYGASPKGTVRISVARGDQDQVWCLRRKLVGGIEDARLLLPTETDLLESEMPPDSVP